MVIITIYGRPFNVVAVSLGGNENELPILDVIVSSKWARFIILLALEATKLSV